MLRVNISISFSKFAKIESADIRIDDLTLFVGENNTGKSLTMMLIYAVLDEIKRVTSPGHIAMDFSVLGIEKSNKGYRVELKWITEWVSAFNDYFISNKEAIILHYFRKSIPLEDLRVNINFEKDEDFEFIKEGDYFSLFLDKSGDRKELARLIYDSTGEDETRNKQLIGNALIIELFSLSRYMPSDGLYLPASRTGLQLLYRYFIAEKEKRNFFAHSMEKNEFFPSMGLTLPVYEYLLFLLTYTLKTPISECNNEILQFIYQNLLEGSLDLKWEEEVYIPKGKKKNRIPLYLASSMVNEVTPIVKLLSGESDYKYVFYDEIETCLHPLKQGQMARVIVRMVNAGWKMIVSTHSDTMASKLNNLFMLANKNENDREKVLKKLKYDNGDILKKNVVVYEFKTVGGVSQVEELPYVCTSMIGYNFRLFSKNIDQLYDETELITSK